MGRELPHTAEEYLSRWPHVSALMIANSLGYFTPTAAALALKHYKENEPFACEWYSHICNCRGKGYFDHEELRKIGHETLQHAIQTRAHLRGYMADYPAALAIVRRQLDTGERPVLASWF